MNSPMNRFDGLFFTGLIMMVIVFHLDGSIWVPAIITVVGLWGSAAAHGR